MNQRKDVEENLLQQFEPMIHSILKNASQNTVCSYEDLAQEARIAVIFAYRSYDPKYGTALNTWIYKNISDSIIEYQKKNLSALSGGAYGYRLLKKAGPNPTVEKLVKMGSSKKTAVAALHFSNSYLTKSVEDGGLDKVGDEKTKFTIGNRVQDFFYLLSPEEKKVIFMKYGFDDQGPLPERMISETLHISSNQVRRLVGSSIRKMRNCKEIWSLVEY